MQCLDSGLRPIDHHQKYFKKLDYTRLRRARLCRDMTRLRRGLARPRLRRVARGKPAARKAAASPLGRGFAATHGPWHVPTTINIEILTQKW